MASRCFWRSARCCRARSGVSLSGSFGNGGPIGAAGDSCCGLLPRPDVAPGSPRVNRGTLRREPGPASSGRRRLELWAHLHSGETCLANAVWRRQSSEGWLAQADYAKAGWRCLLC
ncbi:hypothetical protein CHLRE_01g020751v5 [Chlamydomonas reinhardtii]|uniref:Uncharacterized protein n=1 Tax=Chlamydomonas reinhardtii TaxID=3055 RepID=A0A2K3E611_CHLRE|nr:uncharacterized protein CHLRE_01g020751v5 [Chlamydomonas reinhardtii]PNW88239.1 hypothetical protein CHLRE_01g020751v5 [Chlamydomonas reinhardtii]